jgi:hypothetical protein
MFFKKEKNDKDLNNLLSLQSIVSKLHERLIYYRNVIKNKNDLITIKDNKIIHLETILQSNDHIIDDDTKLYTRDYYIKYLQQKLNDNYYVLTIKIMNYEHKFDQFHRKDISHVIRNFCIGMEMTPVLWDADVIKIFLLVDEKKSEKLKRTIVHLLKQNLSDKELSLEFKKFQL